SASRPRLVSIRGMKLALRWSYGVRQKYGISTAKCATNSQKQLGTEMACFQGFQVHRQTWRDVRIRRNCFHTAGATGSIPVPPTIQNKDLSRDPEDLLLEFGTLGSDRAPITIASRARKVLPWECPRATWVSEPTMPHRRLTQPAASRPKCQAWSDNVVIKEI